jgi:hypothetical protein
VAIAWAEGAGTAANVEASRAASAKSFFIRFLLEPRAPRRGAPSLFQVLFREETSRLRTGDLQRADAIKVIWYADCGIEPESVFPGSLGSPAQL